MKEETSVEIQDTLRTWELLNAKIRKASEGDCQRYLQAELAGRHRLQFVLRIFSRFNRMRAARERKELRARIR